MKEKALMIVFVLVLGSILTSALVAVDAFTAPYIKANKVKKLHGSVLGALGIDYTPDSLEEVFSKEIEEKVFPEALQEEGADEEKKFFVTKAGREVVFIFGGSGLWGPINGAIAFKGDLKTIKGITIIHQEETPGLGGRIGEPEFLDRFKNKRVFPELLIQSPGKASRDNEIDGITGATLSCKALEEILNSESKKYMPAIEEVVKNDS
jgi:Na+-transporting NADH:ubiquinone oxidoreductase subunit C